MIISVKENADGSFFYSYETYRPENTNKALKRKRITTKPALAGADTSVNVDNSSMDRVSLAEAKGKGDFSISGDKARWTEDHIDRIMHEYASSDRG